VCGRPSASIEDVADGVAEFEADITLPNVHEGVSTPVRRADPGDDIVQRRTISTGSVRVLRT